MGHGPNSKCFEPVTFLVPGLEDSIRSYSLENSRDVDLGLITIAFESHKDTISILISSTHLLGEMPSSYLMIEKKPVLIYTGLEEIARQSRDYQEYIIEITNPFLESVGKDQDGRWNLPSTYNPPAWRVKVVNGRIVKKTVVN